MNPLALTKIMRPMKKDLAIVLGVMGTLLVLPLVAIASVTDLGALADSGNQLYSGTASTANTYDYGYCTFWVAQRRIEVGKPVPNTWGNANTWDTGALFSGYRVDHTPEQYAIMQTDAGDLGHVAFVEKVEADGSWTISEMNVKGWDILSSRTFKPGEAKNYIFIH